MKTLLIGTGAAGNKAVLEAVMEGIVTPQDAIMVNSTSKDFPENFSGQKIIISPSNAGCGKERSIAKDCVLNAIKAGKFNDIKDINSYTTVIICTSVEGGTGSGSAPILAKFFNQVMKKNVHIIAFSGFGDDVRGLGNTVEFFQELDRNIIVQIIQNNNFLAQAKGNKFKAESLANAEMAKRIAILTGKDLIPSSQNIDDTDILKVSNTSGYMTVEHMLLDNPVMDQEDYDRVINKMIYNSKSAKSEGGCARIGIILNINPESDSDNGIKNIDEVLKKTYGNPFERFAHTQWDGKQEYIAYIISGMNMPLEEIKAIYDNYKEETSKVNKTSDSFFEEMKSMSISAEDKKFDMIKPVQSGVNMSDFLTQFETQ